VTGEDPPTDSSLAVTRIQSWIESHADADQGFASVTIDGPNRLNVAWKGRPPKEFLDLTSKLSNVEIQIVQTGLSAADVNARVQAILAHAKSQDVRIKTIGPSADNSRIVAGLDAGMSSTERSRSERIIREAAQNVPVDINYDDHTYEFASDRRHDTPPFWGGSVVVSLTDGERCTTLAPVVKKDSGVAGIVTARHCGFDQLYETYSDGTGGTDIGVAQSGNESVDGVFIQGETYGTRAYIGAWDSSDNEPVTGSSNPARYEHVCTNGGLEGRHCSGPIEVESVGQYTSIGDKTYGPGFWFSNRDFSGGVAHAAIGKGDSGSAIFVWANDSHTAITVRGMVIILDEFSIEPCEGSPDFPLRRCSYRGFAMNISAVKDKLNVNMKTP
jgi:hypothetical protein